MEEETEIALVLDEGAELLGRYRPGEIPPTWLHNLDSLAWFGSVHHLLHVKADSDLGVLHREFMAFLWAAFHMGVESVSLPGNAATSQGG